MQRLFRRLNRLLQNETSNKRVTYLQQYDTPQRNYDREVTIVNKGKKFVKQNASHR